MTDELETTEYEIEVPRYDVDGEETGEVTLCEVILRESEPYIYGATTVGRGETRIDLDVVRAWILPIDRLMLQSHESERWILSEAERLAQARFHTEKGAKC